MSISSIAVGQSSEVIVFRSETAWSVANYSRFLSTLELLYGIVLFMSHPRYERDYRKLQIRSFILRDPGIIDKRAGALEELFSAADIGTVAAELVNSLHHDSRYLDELGLRIRRLHLASPGLFSFDGLDKLVEQLRLFFKDLWFENRRQRRLANLEVQRAEMAFAEEYMRSRTNVVKFARQYLKEIKGLQDDLSRTPPEVVSTVELLAAFGADEINKLVAARLLLEDPESIGEEGFL